MQTREDADRDLHSAAPGMQAQSVRDEFEAAAIACKIKTILGSEYPSTVIQLLRTAKRSIDICAYTWKWYDYRSSDAMQRINYAIIEKARQGLPVRTRFNSESKDHILTKENTKTASALRRYKVQTKFDGSPIMSHLKLIIIDQEIAILGSHNLTSRSVSQNNETSIVIFGREAVRAYCGYFEALWTKQL
jgi:phosphatidylserine/phosphatidylglycerophosphate/cardiolipin synthase-like enzyme